MAGIEMKVTPTGRTIKGPGFIARMYGTGLKEYVLQGRDWHEQLREQTMNMDFAEIELRVLGYYSGYDPRNHFGKYATRKQTT